MRFQIQRSIGGSVATAFGEMFVHFRSHLMIFKCEIIVAVIVLHEAYWHSNIATRKPVQ